MITPQTVRYVGLRLSHCQAGRPSAMARGGTSHIDVQRKQMPFVGTINNTNTTTNLYPITQQVYGVSLLASFVVRNNNIHFMTPRVMAEATSYHLPGSGSILVATYLLGTSVNVDMRSKKMCAVSTHNELVQKSEHTHSIEAGGFFELLISKKVIHEEQKQLCNLVQVKEVANCSFIKPTYAHWTYLCWFYT